MGRKLSQREWAEFLGRRNGQRDWSLDRVVALADACGLRRQNHFIHVAGTNGKGSVCAMVERGLREVGLRTGLYTSPHLVSIYERIRVNGQSISGRDFAEAYRQLRPIAGKISARGPRHELSFFEMFTVLSLLIFQERQVDCAIVEVGLGGRLDATNIIVPDLTIITSISLDHEEVLGHTLEAIAREKAGILKAGIPLILGSVPDPARRVILNTAAALRTPVIPAKDRSPFNLRHLKGLEQQENGRIVAAVGDFYFASGPADRERFFRGVEKTRWIGRWQRHQFGHRTLILDSTHNGGGGAFLRENLQNLIADTGQRPVILTATLGLARAKALLPLLADFTDEMVLLELQNERALPFDDLRSCLPPAYRGRIIRFPQKDIANFFAAHPGTLFVVTGSIFLLGEVIRALNLWSLLKKI